MNLSGKNSTNICAGQDFFVPLRFIFNSTAQHSTAQHSTAHTNAYIVFRGEEPDIFLPVF
jgi:hypothetical protein